MKENINITIIGAGYVGMSLSVALAQQNSVKLYDTDEDRVNKINNLQSTVEDADISRFLQEKKLSICGTTSKKEAYKDAKYYIIATPTDFDSETNYFDTSSVESTIKDILNFNHNAIIIIKSTIPIGFTKYLKKIFKTERIIFSPEFLREGMALHDNLYPSRIIAGGSHAPAKAFVNILKECSLNLDVKILIMDSSDAEAVKLFSNAYLAMRVSFFNELDSFALSKNLSSENIIKGVSSDPRIGNHYNNPSFGYGGYCLPKDTKQLLANFENVPQKIFTAIVESNNTRKDFVASVIKDLKPKILGVYRLTMKEGSDNLRVSAIQDIIKILKDKKDIEIIIYEPEITDNSFLGCNLENDLLSFKNKADVIICNRDNGDLKDISNKVFSRDIFGIN
jgi:UDPglucose 6-dehydrogenase|tara:strand:+ start:244 stop:1425 length:1182 start_codon:yes stop_codon:yes gene_type:complete